MFPPKTLKSLAATARIGPGTATVCVATTVPSMENTTLASVQSIVYLWGNPRNPVPRGVSIAAVPVLVRAVSAPPLIVLKIAHGCVALERSCANPECWNASPVNVAMNCRRGPGVIDLCSSQGPAKSEQVPSRDPSTSAMPLPRNADPPAANGTVSQPGDNAEPENSVPTAGARITSPSADSDTYVPVPLPAWKSGVTVSRSVGPGTVTLGAARLVVLPERSTEITR